MKSADAAINLPAHIRAKIGQGQEAFAKRHRFDVDESSKLTTLTADERIDHYRDGTYNALAQYAKENRGQPPMVERFRAAAIIVDWLESIGMPFGVCPDSRMNKALLRLLNDEAERSVDNRKSRRKKITAGAARALLRKIRYLRSITEHFTKFRPYAD